LFDKAQLVRVEIPSFVNVRNGFHLWADDDLGVVAEEIYLNGDKQKIQFRKELDK